MEIRKCYKVCSIVDGGSLTGYIKDYSGIDDFYMTLNYGINLWTFPKIPNSKLFVFDTIKSAIEFLNFELTTRKMTLFECEAINPTPAVKITAPIHKSIVAYWNTPNRDETDWFKVAPIGTLFADAVKLTKNCGKIHNLLDSF